MSLCIKRSRAQGRGVFTNARIRSGARVFRFAEEVRKIEHKPGCHCAICKRCIQVGPQEWLSPKPNSYGWNLNHSCQPNCGIRGHFIVAMRHIQRGEEITIDYSTTNTDTDWVMTCHCGKPNCRHAIKSVQHLIPEDFVRFLGWMPPFIEGSY